MNLTLCGVIAALTILAGASGAEAKEVKLKAAEVPAAVLDSLKVHYPGAEFLGFSKETEKGTTLFETEMKIKGRHVVLGAKITSNYELQVKLNGKQFELLFGADGRLVSKDPADEKD